MAAASSSHATFEQREMRLRKWRKVKGDTPSFEVLTADERAMPSWPEAKLSMRFRASHTHTIRLR